MGKKVTVGYRYFVGMHLGICSGPVDALLEIRAGDRVAWNGQRYTTNTTGSFGVTSYTPTGTPAPCTSNERLVVNAPELFGGEEKEGGLLGELDVMFGRSDQTPNDYLVAQHGPGTPAYRGLFGIVWRRGLVSANNPYIKPWAFKVRRILQGWQGGAAWYASKASISLGGGAQGMNPAHIVYECITNGEWGLGYGSSLIDDANFRAAADTFHAEGLGLCIKWTRQGTIEAFIQSVMDHAGAILAQDRATGLFKLLPLRADYTVSALPLFDESNVVALDSYQRPALPDAVNEISVKFEDVATGLEGSVTVQNLANITAQGGVVTQPRNYPGIPTAELATRIAMRDLRAASTALAKVRFRCNRAGASLLPGQVVRLSWAKLGINQLVLRLVRVNTGTLTDGEVEIEAVEDIFAFPSTTYAAQQPTGWTEPASVPQAATDRVVREATFYELQQELGADAAQALPTDAGYIVAAASTSAGDAQDFGLLTKAASAPSYEEADRSPICPSGALTAPLSHTATTATLSSFVDVDLVTRVGYAQIGAEIVRVDSLNPATGAVTIARGVCGTVAAAHATGARLYFLDGFLAVDPTERVDGEVVNVKLTPRTGRGELAEASAPTDSITLDQVAARPYAPGRFRIGGQAYPSFLDVTPALTWAHRNRLQQNLEGDDVAGNIGPEAGTTYSVEFRNDATDAILVSADGITGTSFTPTGLPSPPRLKVRLWAVRGGLQSAQRHEWAFDYAGPVVAPGATFSTSATLFAGFATNGNGTAQGFSPDIASNNYVPPAQARILRGSAFSEGGNDVLLLLHFNEPNGSTVFADSSIYQASTAALYGGAVTTTGPQFGPGAFLGVMSPLPSRVRIGSEGATPTHLQGFFNLPAWTVEGWAYYPDPNEAFAGFEVLDFSAVDGQAQPIGSKIGFRSWTSFQAPAPFITHGTTTTQSGNCDLVPYGQWFHFAFVKFDGKLKCFINGVSAIRVLSGGGAQDFYSAGTSTAPNTSTVTVGGIVGKLDEVRITKFARYVDDFTPPAAPFPNPSVPLALLVHFDEADGNFVDRSVFARPRTYSNGFASSTTAKAGFGRSIEKLTTGTAQDRVEFGPAIPLLEGQPYCVDFQLRPTTRTDSPAVLIWNGYNVFIRPGIYIETDGRVGISVTNSQGIISSFLASTPAPLNTWTHVAVTFDGTTTRIFYDGVQVGATSTLPLISQISTAPNLISIGGEAQSVGPSFIGQIDEVRFIVGEAVWTGNFTPPTVPYPDPNPPAARYWRIRAITQPGGADYFEISDFNLYEGATRAAGATITASDASGNGSPMSHFDDLETSTRVFWGAATAQAGGFWIRWDFGAGVTKTINGFRFAGFDNSNRFATGFVLEYSSDGTAWATKGTASGLTYPGNLTYSSVIPI